MGFPISPAATVGAKAVLNPIIAMTTSPIPAIIMVLSRLGCEYSSPSSPTSRNPTAGAIMKTSSPAIKTKRLFPTSKGKTADGCHLFSPIYALKQTDPSQAPFRAHLLPSFGEERSSVSGFSRFLRFVDDFVGVPSKKSACRDGESSLGMSRTTLFIDRREVIR